MAEWPDLEALKQVLDTDPSSDAWDERLTVVLDSAISWVKYTGVGRWDEMLDEPDESLSQCALRMAELIATRPEAVPNAGEDPTIGRLLTGHRRRFSFA